MRLSIEEQTGKLTLASILSAAWLGNWDRYDEIFEKLPQQIQDEFTFHKFYDREQVELWYENHFIVPGDYFVSPYFSSYGDGRKDEETRRQELLCLVGYYEDVGFYYPLENDLYPDHFGCLTLFLTSIIQEQVKSIHNGDEENLENLLALEAAILKDYINSVVDQIVEESNKKTLHRFFREFLSYYRKTMVEGWL